MFYRIHQKCLNAKVVPQGGSQACQIRVAAQTAGGSLAVTRHIIYRFRMKDGCGFCNNRSQRSSRPLWMRVWGF